MDRFYPEYDTDAEKTALRLARMMQMYGHRVKVFTYSCHPPSFYDRRLRAIAIKEFVHNGVPVLAFRDCRVEQNTSTDLDDPELAEISDELIRYERPGVVHATACLRVGELLKSAKKLRIPYVVTFTDLSLLRISGSATRDLLKHAGAVAVPSDVVAEALRKEFSGLEIDVIEHGLTHPGDKPGTSQDTATAEQHAYFYECLYRRLVV
jgi:hypothetical protein